jgi:hypothetical protein
MRTPVVCTVFAALALLACHRSVAYVSADDYGIPARATSADSPCNDLEQLGGAVEMFGSRDHPPAAAGGEIVDGTYVLTSSTLYTTERSHGAKIVDMGRITMRVNGATSQLVRATTTGRERRTTVNRTTSGTFATLQTTCVSPRPSDDFSTSTTRYTATNNTIQFVNPGPAGTVVSTYSRL